MRGDCWGTWLIMLGFMDLGWPRVCRRSTSVLSILLLLATLPELYFLTYFPETFDITISKLWCQCICTQSFFIPQNLILSIFEPCSGLFHELMNNSWARLVINAPKEICFARFFVWFRKVIIPARHRRNMAFLSLWNTSLVSFWRVNVTVLKTQLRASVPSTQLRAAGPISGNAARAPIRSTIGSMGPQKPNEQYIERRWRSQRSWCSCAQPTQPAQPELQFEVL